MHRRRISNHLELQGQHRHGLAPVELMLVIPLMMMVAALLLFATNAAVWKLRSHNAAREAVFQQVHPRFGEAPVVPPEWRRPDVSMSVAPGPPVWAEDPFLQHQLFRGPSWRGINVNDTLLDGASGIQIGHAQSNIKSKLWPQMKVSYRFQRDVALLSHQQWQYDAMGLPGNGSRRSIPLLIQAPQPLE